MNLEVAPDDPFFDGDLEHYLQVGMSALENIKMSLLGGRAPLSILDLSCGFGRVTRMLRAQFPAAAITACDLDQRAVDFVRTTFGVRGVYATASLQDLELGEQFDLIWAGSLLAHLPEHLMRHFLDFAVRHMGQDSRLISTGYGGHVADRLRGSSYGLNEPAARGLIVQFLRDGYGFRGYDGSSHIGVALASPAWYEVVLSGSHLVLQSYCERGWDGDQDVVVMRGVHMSYGGQLSNLSYPFFARALAPLPSAAEQALQDQECIPGFDEAWYLHTFTDVAAAVQEGMVSSGLVHFLTSGWKEGRPPFDPERNFVRQVEAKLNRTTLRELGEAALLNLPFLPGVFDTDDHGLTIGGYCGAPSNITSQMAFFVNGQKIGDADYPIQDAVPNKQFLDVPGMGLRFQARIPREQMQDTRFLRFDAAPTGQYQPAAWRRAIHYMATENERFPFPPAVNIKRVIGDTSVERFAMGGATIFNNIANYLRETKHNWDDFRNILDWGCGAGRVTRYLIGETSCAVTGMDIDDDNISWCRENYPGGTFITGPLRPPTEIAEGAFDLVLGLSVLTHLQEQDQFLWLDELRRVTRPGALLFLSVQGPTHFCYTRFPPHLYRRVQEDGYVNLCRDPALDGVIADTEYYRAAMQSRPYILRRWGEFFEVLDIVDAIATPQDFVILRRH